MGVADNAEIEVTLDDRELASGARRGNKALESLGESGKRGSKQASDAIDELAKSAKIAAKEISPLEKRLQAIEKVGRVSGRSGVERIKARQAEAISDVRRLGGGSAEIDRVTAAYDRLIKKQNQTSEAKVAAANERIVRGLQERAKAAQLERLSAVERLRIEERLATASARGRGATANEIQRIAASFGTLKREAREAERQLDSATQLKNRDQALRQIENQTRALEKQASVAGKTGAERIAIERRIALEAAKSAGASAETIQRMSRSFDSLEAAARRTQPAVRSTGEAVAFLAAKALALGAIFKSFVVDTSTVAARYETLQVALHQVARANGVATDAVDVQEKALKRLGISTEGARTILSQFLTTGLPVDRITELAGLARDLGVIMGEDTTDAAKRLTRAIVSQETEILRTLGINIKFSDGHRRLAKQLEVTTDELTDQQKVMANFNSVVEVGPRFLGAYEAAMLTTGKQLTSLKRLQLEATAAIGEAFLPALGTVVNALSGLAEHIAANATWWKRLAQGVAGAGGAVAGLLAFRGVALGLSTLFGVTLNPAIGLTVAAIAGLATLYLATRDKSEVLIQSLRRQREGLQRTREELDLQNLSLQDYRDQLAAIEKKDTFLRLTEQATLLQDKLDHINDLSTRFVATSFGGLTAVRAGKDEIDLTRDLLIQELLQVNAEINALRKVPSEKPSEDENSKLLEKRKRDLDEARKLFERAQREGLSTVEEIFALQRERIKNIGTTRQAVELINRTANLQLKQFREKTIADARKDLRDFETSALGAVSQRFQQTLAEAAQLREEQIRLAETGIEQSIRIEQERIQRVRDLEMAGLRETSGLTIEERTGLASQKLAIEQRFIEAQAALEAESIRRTTRLAIAENKRRAKLTPGLAADLESINVTLIAQQEEVLRSLGEKTGIGILTAQRETAARQANLLADHNQRVFDNFKRQAEGVFDSLTRSGEGFFRSIANSLKTSFLTAIKEVVTSRVALALTQLFSGSTSGVHSPSGGSFGRGLRSGGLFAGLAGTLLAGAPGGTSGFAGPVNQAGLSQIRLPGAAAVSVLAGVRSQERLNESARVLNATTSQAIELAGRRADAERGAADVAIAAAEQQLAATLKVADAQKEAVDIFESSAKRQERAAAGLADQLTRIGQSVAGGLIPRGPQGGLGSLGGGRFGIQSLLQPFIPSLGSSGAPGGTVGFGGPVGGSGGGGAGGGFGGILAGLKGNVAGLREFAGLGNSIQLGPGAATTFQAASLGQKLSGFAGSDAALLAGGALVANGLRQGGIGGLAQTTGGGALIGFKFGGPVGAAIGAGVGAAAGIARLFIKTGTEKAREKIRKMFGLDIKDKAILNQVTSLAKAEFGGSIDAAIASPQIRDLLELYALSHGEAFSGFTARPTPVSLVQRGGALFQQAQFRNGLPQITQSSLPSISLGQSAAGNVTVLKLDGSATTSLLRGEVVQTVNSNPRMIQNATERAAESSFGRRRASALTLEPYALAK